jgi:hypothetical protein
MNWDNSVVTQSVDADCGSIIFEVYQDGGDLDPSIFLLESDPANQDNALIIDLTDVSTKVGEYTMTLSARLDAEGTSAVSKDFVLTIVDPCEAQLTGEASSIADATYTVGQEQMELFFDLMPIEPYHCENSVSFGFSVNPSLPEEASSTISFDPDI